MKRRNSLVAVAALTLTALFALLGLTQEGSRAASRPTIDDALEQPIYRVIRVHGIMEFVMVEGGCWRLTTDSGVHYETVGGPPEMYIDGISGWLVGRLRPDWASFCQVGQIVEVLSWMPDTITIHGVMHFINVEGGCWQFEDDGGAHYQPIQGPTFLYCEGASGTITAFPRPDLASTCQVGEIIQVLDFAPDTFRVHGVMHFIDVEGGCWQFTSDAGHHYEPLGGPTHMYQEGASGFMTAFDRCDLGSYCQVGEIVEVVSFIADWTHHHEEQTLD